MLKIDQEWIKEGDADTKDVEYIDEKLMVSIRLCIYKKDGQQKVVPYAKKTENPRLSRSDLSLAAIVAEELYNQIGEFTLILPQIRGEAKIDSSNFEGAIMAGVAKALREGYITLF